MLLRTISGSRTGSRPCSTTTIAVGRAARSAVRTLVEAAVTVVIVAALVRTWLVQVFTVDGSSMATTLVAEHVDIECPGCGLSFPAGLEGTASNNRAPSAPIAASPRAASTPQTPQAETSCSSTRPPSCGDDRGAGKLSRCGLARRRQGVRQACGRPAWRRGLDHRW